MISKVCEMIGPRRLDVTRRFVAMLAMLAALVNTATAVMHGAQHRHEEAAHHSLEHVASTVWVTAAPHYVAASATAEAADASDDHAALHMRTVAVLPIKDVDGLPSAPVRVAPLDYAVSLDAVLATAWTPLPTLRVRGPLQPRAPPLFA